MSNMYLANAWSAGEMWVVCYRCSRYLPLGVSVREASCEGVGRRWRVLEGAFRVRHRACSLVKRSGFDAVEVDSSFCLDYLKDEHGYALEPFTPTELLSLEGRSHG